MISAKRRLFVLLGAYEDLTDRETDALRRGDIEYVLAIQERKARLTETLQTMRRDIELSVEDEAVLAERVRSLQVIQSGNLSSLRDQMGEVKHALDQVGQAYQRSRQVRRGYTGITTGMQDSVESVLGRA